MMGQEIVARKLNWSEVGTAIRNKLKTILGKDIICVAKKEAPDYWAIFFIGYKMPITEVEFLLDILDADVEMREEAIPLPEDNETTVKSMGMLMARALLYKEINFTWKAEFLDEDSLWILDTNKQA